jgi:hypothetical protein
MYERSPEISYILCSAKLLWRTEHKAETTESNYISNAVFQENGKECYWLSVC